MTILNLEKALDITIAALKKGRELSAAPLTVAVLDPAGQLISLQREDGSSLLRPDIATAKAWGRSPLASPRVHWRLMPNSARPLSVRSTRLPRGGWCRCRAEC
ncbi:GlcG/HbpS family heme-binding protein [Marinobacterium aestuariivivens]|uniref:Heme-binding protein n=1 Tax=Marinobacterium aestuariivivens TaxID=1698799 RepID=A0ABW2A0Q1_9GAMM